MNLVIIKLAAILGYIASIFGHGIEPHSLSPQFPNWYPHEYDSYNSYDLLSSYPPGPEHPCDRKCIVGQSMTCYYEFVVHYYEAASRICAIYGNDSSRGCIRSDGVATGIVVVNRQLGGPRVVVCENDTIVADVVNNLREGTTIHWHGLRMKETPHMDGAPYTTQYPINPGEVFRYNFFVRQHGTYWWHSHMGMQRAYGLAGPIVSRQADELNPFATLYDYDLTQHIVYLTDWFYNFTSATPRNVLINGKGHNNETTSHKRLLKASLNYERFRVVQGRRYRFRVVYNGNANCPLELSIDNHDLHVISSDGVDMSPVTVKSIVLLAAERYDFVLYATNEIASYWMRVKAHGFCEKSQIYQAAIVQYRGTYEYGGVPKPKLSFEYKEKGRQLNPVDAEPSENPDHLTLFEVDGLYYTEWDEETEFKTYYSNLGVYVGEGKFGFQMDDIYFEMPALSLLQARFLDIEPFFCNKTSLKAKGRDCKKEMCKCWNIIQVPAYDYIEFVISSDTARGHPFHSHGFDFRVVGMGILGKDDIKRIEEIDKATPLIRRTDRLSAVKDTVQVPGYGYAIIRFFTDNPGFWMFHCHLSVHSEDGMMAVLQVGEMDQMVPTPKNNCYGNKKEYRFAMK